MTNDLIDQIEFRWTLYDFDAIAFSDPTYGHRFAQLVRGYAALSEGMDDEPVPTRSAVYYCTENGQAALILRSNNPGARKVVQSAEPRRHALVARVFTGSARALSPRLAMCLATIPIPEALGPQPGQAGIDDPLPGLAVRDLEVLADPARHDLTSRAKEDRRLPALIAARLNWSDQPLNAILAAAELARPPGAGGPAIPLLWGLAHTADRLLFGPDAVPGWPMTFSTYEPPLRDGEGRRMPQIIFQARTIAGGHPAFGFQKVDLTQAGDTNGFAVGLAEACRELGYELQRYLDAAWHAGSDLGQRMSHLRSEPDLRAYWSVPTPAATGTGRIEPRLQHGPAAAPTGGGSHRRAGAHGGSYGELSGLGETRGRDGAGSDKPSDPSTQAPGTSPAPGRAREDPYLIRMYGRLDGAGGCFRTVVALLESKGRLGHVPPAEDCKAILEQFRRSGWYLEQLLREYEAKAAVAVLARLLLPLVSGLPPHTPMFADPEVWSKESPLLHEALAKVRGHLDGVPGEQLEDLIVKLVKVNLGAGLLPVPPQPPPESAPAPEPEQPPGRVAGIPVAALSARTVAWLAWWAIAATLFALLGWL
jgi:hypothetical protein